MGCAFPKSQKLPNDPKPGLNAGSGCGLQFSWANITLEFN